MFKPTFIVFIVIFALEAAVIIAGNMFTIFVFWTQRSHLKRTYFLLINLAMADLLVGITEPIVIGTENVPIMKARGQMKHAQRMKNPTPAIQLFGSSASVIFLALISLERAHAVLRPLRHRVTSTCVYICAIVVAWTAALCIAGTKLLSIYHTDVNKEHAAVIIHSCLFLCVLVICGSFLMIRTRLHSATPEPELHRHQSTEQNSRLSRTFFIVAAVSLMFWLPAIIVFTIMEFCRQKCGISQTVVGIVNCLHLANSLVNPFVYCFRMPIFKNALKKCCGRRVDIIESRPLPLNVKNEAVEFTVRATK